MEDSPRIDTPALCKAAVGLTRGRLLDVDWTDENADVLTRLAGLQTNGGISAEGEIIDRFVLTGKAHCEIITQQEIDIIRDAFPELTLTYGEIVREVKDQMAGVKEDLGEMKDESREDKAKAARNRILICADEVYQGVKHSKEYFDNILADITFYKRYCDEHPEFQNEMTVMATERIESIYKKCLEEHGFL